MHADCNNKKLIIMLHVNVQIFTTMIHSDTHVKIYILTHTYFTLCKAKLIVYIV